ncbi:menaquinol-cytochrome c reductase cytochrome b subunit precursor [Thermomonospora echinospora]|uniref:Cytochrome bc1 complex cytochrome b subunit n=1 Tax=Thermomonospora echinospora TaxID=1992 RepID=A0A1H6CZX8_9ACTN|nr:cytochrome bc complex cytochrome b subunit [Thermomonospora echinospora]SEG78334.1 menaquinol-cytochrome c reductase cytochrome b subunit precursor [Thermomonospora echinospora]
MTNPQRPGKTLRLLKEQGRAVDDRYGGAKFGAKAIKKAFPDHWSFLLGEIALYSFAILVLTGVFLTFFFRPSATEMIYHGSYAPLNGVRMTEAYASTLDLSFDVRGGLLMRQVHHWATLIFLAAILAHMLRNFFTGAFRKPREGNWVIGVVLFLLVLLNGLFGYSLPDDLLSGTGVRILAGVLLALPLVGSYLTMFVFGGEFPGDAFIPRLFTVHVLLIPGILAALIPLHAVVLTWRQTHTTFPGRGATDTTQKGYPFFPVFVAKTTAYLFWTFGVIALLATFFQINPVWLYGPYDPGAISAGSQPDWYMGFLDGSLRLMPGWEIDFLGHTLPMSVLIPALVIPGLLFTGLIVYPWLERWVTGDHEVHNVLDRPRDVPVRTGIGIGGVVFYGVLWLAGASDIIAKTFHVPLYGTIWFFRIALLVGPVIGYFVAYRICLGLQRRDRAMLEHGVETGVIVMAPDGKFGELEAPLSRDLASPLVERRRPTALPLSRPELPGVRAPRARGGLTTRFRMELNQIFIRDLWEATKPRPDGEVRSEEEQRALEK